MKTAATVLLFLILWGLSTYAQVWFGWTTYGKANSMVYNATIVVVTYVLFEKIAMGR